MARPLCRYCGKPIAKRTTTVRFVETQEQADRDNKVGWTWTRSVVGSPSTKAEAQRLVNEEIVSVKRGAIRGGGLKADLIASVGVWDGTSYADQFFCNGAHAQGFAYAVLQSDQYKSLGLPDWHLAIEKSERGLKFPL